MTAPGWYNAQGDAPGTHRYWDGAQWIGDPVPAATEQIPQVNTFDPSYGAYNMVIGDQAAPTPAPVEGPPEELTFLPGLKVLAVAISALKAIPLIIFALILRWLVDQGRDLDRAIGSGNAATIRDSANTVYLVIGFFAALLLLQLIAALSERPLFLFVIAFVLTLLDIWSTVQQATNGSVFVLALTFMMTVAQAGMTFWAWTVYRNRNVGRVAP